MKKYIYIVLAAAAMAFAGCKEKPVELGPTGLQLKISAEGNYVDKVVKAGFLKRLSELTADKEIEFKKDVDAVSQATKTSKGVCNAVNQAIEWYNLVKGGVAGE